MPVHFLLYAEFGFQEREILCRGIFDDVIWIYCKHVFDVEVKLLIFIFEILQFGPCWQIIRLPAELVEFIKTKPPSVSKRLGVAFEADRSRHPV